VRALPIVSVEDPFAEDDFSAWAAFTKRMGNKNQIIGDDLFTTNLERIKYGIGEQLANAVLIKVNQIGTVTRHWECIRATSRANGILSFQRARAKPKILLFATLQSPPMSAS
jgi:enolase